MFEVWVINHPWEFAKERFYWRNLNNDRLDWEHIHRGYSHPEDSEFKEKGE